MRATRRSSSGLHQQLGLDLPIPAQYLAGSAMCCVAISATPTGNQQSVASLIAENMPATIQLTIASLALSLLLRLGDRRVAAIRRNQAPTPRRWRGAHLHVDPQLLARAAADPDVRGRAALVRRRRRHVVEGPRPARPPPGAGHGGFNARFVRSSVMQAQTQRYVLTARAKGIRRGRCSAGTCCATRCCRS